MFAQAVSTWLQRRGLHFSWVMVALTFLTGLSSAAALGLPGALLQPLSREFGWDVEQISSALAVRFALFGLMGPFAAIFMERFGLRNVVVTALTLVASGMALATQMTQFWHLVLFWGIMLGVGSGMTALVLSAVVSNRWFERHRGLVVGILTASSATGQLIFLPVGAWMIEHMGWRLAVVPVFAACALMAVAVLLLMRNRPSDVGLAPFGAAPGTPTAAPPAMHVTLATPFKILAEASRSSVFWILAATFFICGLSTNGLIQTHFISLCGDAGLGPVPAASVLAMMGAFDLIGTIGSGWLSDRYDNRKLLLMYYGLRGLSLLWLPYSEFTLYGLSTFAMFYGLDWIATVPPTVRLTAATFGKEKAGMVFGWIFAAHQLGAAVAAYGAGRVRTLLLTYNPALFAAGAACLVAAAIIMMIRRPAAASTAMPATPAKAA
ncbi:Sugar phosphate permease [Duganella sacchari]|uniref:Sugar phosphate permease n=1 Tax=Duganella sacchari TaxID=551987 RepID=A0A1M7R5R2_9BURK|nr:MFS transporter [Duganella sacchari]SHN40764.1 Sugar phosphate permease [Duganella sacchari]